MTTVSPGRSMPNRWRAHAALGTAAAAHGGCGHSRRRRTAHWCRSAQRCDLCKHDRIEEAARRYLAVLPGGIPVPAARRESTRPIRP